MQRTAGLLTALVLVALAGAWTYRERIVERARAWLPRAAETPTAPPAEPAAPVQLPWPRQEAARERPVARDFFTVADALPQVWLEPGDRLLAQPRDGSVVAELDRHVNVKVLERRDGWVRVAWRGHVGWLPEPPEPAPPPPVLEPVRPVAAMRPDAARLAVARELLGAGERVARVGAYPLYTDSRDAAALLLLDRAAAGVEEAYRARYGLAPLGEPAEAVVLFQRREEYEALLARAGGPRGASGHVSSGVVALWREGRELDETRATLVHEIAHLVNRRALGPALPPWLDEGIAVDLGESRFGEGGRLLPGTRHEAERRSTVAVQYLVAGASRRQVEEAAGRGELPPLAALTASPESFAAAAPRSLAYAQAGFLVRFLLAGERAPAFRRFLAGVAEGGDPSGAGLLAALGEPGWEGLERDFRAWLGGLGDPGSPAAPPGIDPP